MAEAPTYAKDRSTILIHYYRAMVGRADTWRMRMDATTNWAIVVTAGMTSFALGSEAAPHWSLAIVSLMTLSFLLLEARRLCFYNLWQRRVLLVEQGIIRPALLAGELEGEGASAKLEATFRESLEPHLGRTVPEMRMRKAIARRLRRVYCYLIAVQTLAWVIKLASHPSQATSVAEMVGRAQVGPLPGAVVVGLVASSLVFVLAFAGALGGRSR